MLKEEYYEEFLKTFETTILDALKPNMIFTLTGGWDTRIIAGILARNNINLPTMSFGSKLENLIGGKIASLLKFKHYFCSSPEKLQELRENGIKYLLGGGFFDEVNGSWAGFKAGTTEQFEYAVKTAMQNRFNYISKYHRKNLYPEMILPILDTRVLACLHKIPWQFRIGKKMQRWILQNKFPKLYHIIYYNSLLPYFLPYRLHGYSNILHMHLVKMFRSNFIFKVET